MLGFISALKIIGNVLSFGLCTRTMQVLSIIWITWLIEENRLFCTIENRQTAYEYHINENVILS